MQKSGFTLIELMIVVAIIALLAMISIPSFKNYLARAKRAEAYSMLSSLATAQKVHWTEHGTYASALSGQNSLGWRPQGYSQGQEPAFYYTYGFPGSEGTNYFVGKFGSDTSGLSQAHADEKGFVAIATGDIDGDGVSDIMRVDQDGKITIIQDDLE